MTIQNDYLQNGLGVNHASKSYFIAQKKQVFEYLMDKIATASMVASSLGIPQKNITRYKRELEESGLLKEVKEDQCKITRRLAWYITTDKNLFPTIAQLPLFPND